MAGANEDTIAKRLKKAIRRSFPDVKSFQAALPKKAKGTSKGSVQAYLDGTIQPSLEFLQVAADLLNVRVEWLAFGSGQRDKNLQRIKEDRGVHPFWVSARKTVPQLAEWPHATSAVFMYALEIYAFSFRGARPVLMPSGDPMQHSKEAVGTLAGDLFGMISQEYRFANIDDLSHREFTQYMVPRIMALMSILPESDQGPDITTRFPPETSHSSTREYDHG